MYILEKVIVTCIYL